MAKQLMETCDLCHLADGFCRCHRSANRSRRVSNDDRLRAAGFTIKKRPKDGRNIWERGRLPYDELTALEMAAQELERD